MEAYRTYDQAGRSEISVILLVQEYIFQRIKLSNGKQPLSFQKSIVLRAPLFVTVLRNTDNQHLLGLLHSTHNENN